MGGKFEDAIEYQRAALEEYIAPIPTIIFDDVVGFRFDPKIEPNECYTH